MSLPQYGDDKETRLDWLSKIPAHWQIVAFRRTLATAPINGIFKKKEEFGNGVPLINVFDIYRDDFRIDYSSLERVRCTINEQQAYQVNTGDIFFVRSSLKLEGIAAVSVAEAPEEPLVFECHLIRARTDQSNLDGRFCSYFFNSSECRQQMVNRAKVTTMTTIDQDALLSFPVVRPPITEQLMIVAFLNRETAKIASLISEQQRLIELLMEKRQAMISSAVTKGLNPSVRMKDSGIDWLGGIPEHWSLKRLGVVADLIQTGPFGSQLHSEDYVEGQTPVINPSNIQDGVIVANWACTVGQGVVERLSHHKLQEGDIVFARRGEMGRCATVSGQEAGWLCGTGSLTVRMNRTMNSEFVSIFLRTGYVRNRLEIDSVGSTMDNLNTSIVSRIPIPVPPVEEQKSICAFLRFESAKLDDLMNEVLSAKSLLQERRTALISAAVTGKIDVRGLATAEPETEAAA